MIVLIRKRHIGIILRKISTTKIMIVGLTKVVIEETTSIRVVVNYYSFEFLC